MVFQVKYSGAPNRSTLKGICVRGRGAGTMSWCGLLEFGVLAVTSAGVFSAMSFTGAAGWVAPRVGRVVWALVVLFGDRASLVAFGSLAPFAPLAVLALPASLPSLASLAMASEAFLLWALERWRRWVLVVVVDLELAVRSLAGWVIWWAVWVMAGDRWRDAEAGAVLVVELVAAAALVAFVAAAGAAVARAASVLGAGVFAMVAPGVDAVGVAPAGVVPAGLLVASAAAVVAGLGAPVFAFAGVEFGFAAALSEAVGVWVAIVAGVAVVAGESAAGRAS